MATIIPIKGLRYDISKIEDIGALVAPPYDIISDIAQERYYQRHLYNIVRLEYGKVSSQDNEGYNRYTRAAIDFAGWQQTDILVAEAEPSLYLHKQEFTIKNGEKKVRTNLICGVRLEHYDKKIILPHEETLPKHKADRLALMKACRANFSPIFTLYLDKEMTVNQLLEKASQEKPPEVKFTDENGQIHQLQVINDPVIIQQVQAFMSKQQFFIADGHHRYETALTYFNELEVEEASPTSSYYNDISQEPLYYYILMSLVNLYDPGLVVLPTHRLIKNIKSLNIEKFLEEIKNDFEIEQFPLADDNSNFQQFIKLMANNVYDTHIENNANNALSTSHLHKFGLYCGNKKLYLLTLKENHSGSHLMLKDKSPAWQGLDVSVLQTLILEKYLRIGKEQVERESNLTYTTEEENALIAVDRNEYQLAFFLNPTAVSEVIAVASAGEKMPQKSTYFYPKVISGLVLNKLE